MSQLEQQEIQLRWKNRPDHFLPQCDTRLCTLLILVAAPYTPHMSIFDYLNTLSNGGQFLINFLTVLPSRRPQLISVFNDHE
ncbi:UNVERIFIED_ORG: hypothetical protein QFZ59_003497 [Bacillus sp. B2I3]|nr:hypothetical protein [Bacillus sp. B2I3]